MSTSRGRLSGYAGGLFKAISDTFPSLSLPSLSLPSLNFLTACTQPPQIDRSEEPPLSEEQPTRATLTADAEKSLSESFQSLFFRAPPGLPTDRIKRQSISENPSFHLVERVTIDETKEEYYFKHNERGSLMSALETIAWAFYEMMAPECVPPDMHMHYDDTCEFVGVSSKAIPGFKSILEDPLIIEDLRNEKTAARLIICLLLSYIFKEDDLHMGNLSKQGIRIDFDMSLWDILCHFKQGRLVDGILRFPDEKTFIVTEKDILNFPDIEDAKPFYWPTKPQPYIPKSARQTLPSCFMPAKNAFRDSDNDIFKELKHCKSGNYPKYKTLLKFILTQKDIYSQIIKMYLPKEASLHGKSLLDIISDNMAFRILEFRNVLLNMSAFREFLARHSKEAFEEIIQEFKQYNQKFKERFFVDEEISSPINLEQINTAYLFLCHDADAMAHEATSPRYHAL